MSSLIWYPPACFFRSTWVKLTWLQTNWKHVPTGSFACGVFTTSKYNQPALSAADAPTSTSPSSILSSRMRHFGLTFMRWSNVVWNPVIRCVIKTRNTEEYSKSKWIQVVKMYKIEWNPLQKLLGHLKSVISIQMTLSLSGNIAQEYWCKRMKANSCWFLYFQISVVKWRWCFYCTTETL